MPDDPELRRLLWYLLGGARGGENRARIIQEIRNRPGNLNQLATRLSLEYRSVQHHIEILKRNALVTSQGDHYGLTYFLSPWLEAHLEVFDEISKKLDLKLAPAPKQSGTDL
ncbi:MAG: winged helix-turn-helix domain-containing protein [Thaumarchaeota archaeon]|nr:winged helix-turn-helix domain-containing protein [Nitrososphaerota archaeon]